MYYCDVKITGIEKFRANVLRFIMRLKGYKIERTFNSYCSNFDLDGMPMNMSRHNRYAGYSSYRWVKRGLFRGTVVKEMPYVRV